MTQPDRQQRLTSLTGIALVNLATLSWATNMILGRYLRDEIGPLTLAASRFLLASVLLAALLRRRPPEERRLGKDRFWLLGMALSGVAIFAPSLYLGLRYTMAVNATLINGFGPLITGLLAVVLIGERMSRRQLLGAILALVGIAVLISGGSLAALRALQVNIGDLIILGSVALWGLYSVLGRHVMRERSALSATALSTFLGVPLLVVGAIWEASVLPVTPSARLVLAVVYIAIVPTVIGFLAWNEGVRRLGSGGAMVFYNTLPVYGALLGFLLLGESIGLPHLLGGALIIGGGLWAARSR